MIKKKHIILAIIFWLFGSIWRMYGTSNFNFPYWFDLGRDAIVSREIIENRDIKIQGPTASGTNDTIFHGVLYYYIIGPLYTVFSGNPQYVMYGVILISSLGVIPFYFLILSMTKKESIANLVGLMAIFSHEFYEAATWLSNPVIAVFSLPLFFYLFWLIFFEGKRKLLPWLLLTLAITHQAAILFAPWWGLVLIGFLLEYQKNNLKRWKIKTLVYSAGVYFLGVLTMILTQLKLWKVGIFSLKALSSFSQRGFFNPKEPVSVITGQYYSKILQAIYPSLPVVSIIVFIILLIFAYKYLNEKIKAFLLIAFASPLLLFSWHYRVAYHSLMTIELFLIFMLACLCDFLWAKKAGKIIAVALILIFFVSNISIWHKVRTLKVAEYFVPQGAYLTDLLDAVDYTYQEAAGDAFSISTITNPYGYNTLWSYLYSWYGQEKYGYLPHWYGMDQTGMFGDNLLSRVNRPDALHFSIREPDQGMPQHIYDWFELEQNAVATPSAKVLFGSLDVRKHEPVLRI